METILSKDSIRSFLESLYEKGRSGNTIRAYAGDMNGLLDWVHLSQGGHSTFEKAAAAYLNTSRRTSSARTTVRRITTFRNYGKFAGLGVILDEYSAPRPPKARPHPLDGGMGSVDKMLEACGSTTESAFVALLGKCALRVSEARSIRACDFDLTSMTLEVTGKGDKTRHIPISSSAWASISPAVEQIGFSGRPIIPYSDRTARRVWTRIADSAGYPESSSHDGRATLATAMMNKTGNIRTVQEMLGHSSSATTEMYTQVTMNQMRAGAEL